MNISDQQNLYFSKDFAFPFILIFKVFICFIQAKFEGNPFSWSSMAPRRVCKVPQPMGIQSLTRGAGGNERVQTEELRGMRTKVRTGTSSLFQKRAQANATQDAILEKTSRTSLALDFPWPSTPGILFHC